MSLIHKNPGFQVLILAAAYSLLFFIFAILTPPPDSQLLPACLSELDLSDNYLSTINERSLAPALLVPNYAQNILDRPAPWRFRLMGTTLVWGIWRFLNLIGIAAPSWAIHAALNWFFGAWTVVTFYSLLRKDLELSPAWSLIGGLGMITAFPLLFAYDAEVMSRIDDILAYFWVATGIRLLLQKRYGWFLVISIVAALTRETTLVLILILVFVGELDVLKRLAIGLPALFTMVAIRLLLDTGQSSYLFSGMGMNFGLYPPGVTGGVIPLPDSAAYAFAALGIWWLLFITGWVALRVVRYSLPRCQRLLWRSAILCWPAAVGTSILLGALRENRLLFLSFPWTIGVSIIALSHYWNDIKVAMSQRGFLKRAMVVSAGFAGILVLAGGWYILSNPAQGHLEVLINTPVAGVIFSIIYRGWVSFNRVLTMNIVQKIHLVANLAGSAIMLIGLLLYWPGLWRKPRQPDANESTGLSQDSAKVTSE